MKPMGDWSNDHPGQDNDPLDDDRDPTNPVEMDGDGWSEFYDKLGDDYEDYMDHDHSMDA